EAPSAPTRTTTPPASSPAAATGAVWRMSPRMTPTVARRPAVEPAEPVGRPSDRGSALSLEGCWGAGSRPVVFIGPAWLPEHKVRIRKEGSRKMSDSSMMVAGIDTGKGKLHVCLSPKGERFSVDNSAAGIATLVARCREAGVKRAGIEATSIYHRAAARGRGEGGIENPGLQPRPARGLAGGLLKGGKD